MSGLEHYGNEIYLMETRISRVAIACGIDISNKLHVEAVKSGNFSFCVSGDQHSYRLLQELLQMLDYITLHCVGERGASECNRIFKEVEARLQSHGMGNHDFGQPED